LGTPGSLVVTVPPREAFQHVHVCFSPISVSTRALLRFGKKFTHIGRIVSSFFLPLGYIEEPIELSNIIIFAVILVT
jgi:hypothetical protein